MAKLIQAFADNRGEIHSNAIDATISDLATMLGRIGAEAGITSGVAKLLLEKRSEIEAIFAEHDAMTCAARP